jgi:predicted tellurium resistance membrane protein TerC
MSSSVRRACSPSSRLTFLEIVVGVDNVIFISIRSATLPTHEQPGARRAGLLGAMLMRSWRARIATDG